MIMDHDMEFWNTGVGALAICVAFSGLLSMDLPPVEFRFRLVMDGKDRRPGLDCLTFPTMMEGGMYIHFLDVSSA
jgi:hypothetical protein